MMLKPALGAMLLLLGIGSAPWAADGDAGWDARLDAAREHVFPFVVSIMTVREEHRNGEPRLNVVSGSGTIISREGHVVTNAHVVREGIRFRLVLADKSEVDARLLASDPLSDLAVLSFDPGSVPLPGTVLPVFGDSEALAPGDYVLAMGAPWGFSQSMSLGVVNNRERLLVGVFQDEGDYEALLDRDQPTARYYHWIQHDAAIAPGNSGGPLVNLEGEIVGVNTRAVAMGGNMGFAIPGTLVKRVTAELVENGYVRRSFFGLNLRSLRGTRWNEGVLISSVVEGSPAESAGLRPGDRIVVLDGEPLTVRFPEELPDFRRRLSERPVGAWLDVEYRRDGETLRTRLRSTAYPRESGERLALKAWGLTLKDLTAYMARNRRLPDDRGLLISGVARGGPAAEARPPLLAGDVIRSVNGEAVDDLEALRARLDEGHNRVIIEVYRRGQSVLTALQPQEEAWTPRNLRVLDKPWPGLEVQAVTATDGRVLGLGRAGFRITRVYPGTAAMAAGLQVGDLVTETDGEALVPANARDDRALDRRVANRTPGEPVVYTIVRGGETLQIAAKLEPLPPGKDEMARQRDLRFDLEVRELSFFDRAENDWWDLERGVLVTEVERGGWAGIAHIRARDVILSIDDRDIRGLEDFRQALADFDETSQPVLEFLVLRGAETRLLFLDAMASMED